MNILKINGKEKNETGGFRVEVVFPSGNTYEVTVGSPFMGPGNIDTDGETRLRWYFETHPRLPDTDEEKAAWAAGSIVRYGETLFNRVFSDARALAEWRELDNHLDALRVQVYSEDYEFQAFHWEALKDPGESTACCLRGVEFVRISGADTPQLPVEPGPYLNVLMVEARLEGKDNVDYHPVAQAVIDTVESNRMPVRIHLLRPPTFSRLREHLRERREFYHIVHFDVCGDVFTSGEYREAISGDRAMFSNGRRGLGVYEGTRPFFMLVGEEGAADLVAADDAAELLHWAHVPVCILNACGSGVSSSGGALGVSLAMRFLECGVKLVLGMAWPLTETAARIMVPRFYDALIRGDSPGQALNLARQALADDSRRVEGEDCSVVLEDWVLPVEWGTGDISLELHEPYPEV